VRLLTPKLTRAGAPATKSKGCAFLEFSTRPALQTALRLHQSELDGRRINVELTAGGGGKGDARLAKVKARNKDLTTQRVRLSLISPLFLSQPLISTRLLHRPGGISRRRERREWIPYRTKLCSRNVSRRRQGKAMCRAQNVLGPSVMGTKAVFIVGVPRQERSVAHAHGQKTWALV
jgi:RNA recognition motif-containing protein